MSTTHQLKSAEERIAAMNTVKQMLNNSNISGSKIFRKINYSRKFVKFLCGENACEFLGFWSIRNINNHYLLSLFIYLLL